MTPAIIIGIIALAAGGFIVFQGIGLRKMKKLIQQTETSKINLLKEGFVEIKGQVQPYSSKLLKSPFTGKDCVYFCYKIEEKYKDTKGNSHWKTRVFETQNAPFLLKDDSGEALIFPENSQFDISESDHSTSGFMKDPPAHVKKFLEEKKISFEGLFGINKTMRYSERIIEPKKTLYILGNAERNNSDGYNGTFVIKKGKEKILFISDKEEKDILSSYNAKMLSSLIGGGVLAVVGIFLTILFGFSG